MNNKKQSSIEWVVEKLENLIPQGNQIAIGVIFEQAKEMHEMEIITAHFTAQPFNSTMLYNAEQYYKETFGGQDNE